MKYAITVMSVLLAVLIAAALFIGADIMQGKDKVTVSVQDIYGDRSKAYGITLDMESTYRRHLYWNTSYTIGETPKTDTEYRFYSIQQKVEYNRQSDPFTMSDDIKYGFDKDTHVGLQGVYNEMLEELGPGQEGSRTVKLKDYYEYYPLAVFVNIPSNYLGWSSDVVYSDDEYLTNRYGWYATAFNEFFKIPVLETELYNLSIRLGTSSVSIGADRPGTEIFSLESQGVKNDNAFYFVFDAHTSTNTYYGEAQYTHVVDTSLIKDGFGIYKLPYTADSKYKDVDIQVDGLETVFEIDPLNYILELEISEDGKLLYLFTREQEMLYITVIDTVTYTALQKLPVAKMEHRLVYPYIIKENCIAGLVDDSWLYVLSRDHQGLLELDFITEINKHGEDIQWFNDDHLSIGYDGQRLVICMESYTGDGENMNMFVYTQNGLEYHGRYKLSLNRGGTSNDIIYFSGSHFQTVTFE